jgi:REP element-mobilizing transposase RayT
MPTHFHFLVRVKPQENPSKSECSINTSSINPSEGKETFGRGGRYLPKVANLRKVEENNPYSLTISRRVGTLLNSYTQAFNKMWNRHGNLFNQKTNAKHIAEEKYYIALAFYIHQNPVRSELVDSPEEWEFSSYQDYIGMRKGSLPDMELILSKYSREEIVENTKSCKSFRR